MKLTYSGVGPIYCTVTSAAAREHLNEGIFCSSSGCLRPIVRSQQQGRRRGIWRSPLLAAKHCKTSQPTAIWGSRRIHYHQTNKKPEDNKKIKKNKIMKSSFKRGDFLCWNNNNNSNNDADSKNKNFTLNTCMFTGTGNPSVTAQLVGACHAAIVLRE